METQRSGGIAWFIQQEGDAGMWPELLPQALGLFFIDLVSDAEGQKLLLIDKDQSFPLPHPAQGLSHGCVRSMLHWPDQIECHTAQNYLEGGHRWRTVPSNLFVEPALSPDHQPRGIHHQALSLLLSKGSRDSTGLSTALPG